MYYQGSSETQVDGLQTLYLMNPNFVGYSDSDNTTVQKPANMLLFNSATNTAEISHPPLPQSHHFVGVPLSAAVGSPNSNYHNHPTVQELQATHGAIPRVNYNLWKSVDQTGGGNEQNLLSVVASTNAGETTGVSSLLPVRQGLSLTLSAKRGAVCDEVNNLQSVILGSKYLKAAQQLLDELVVVGKGGKTDGLAGEAAERRKIIGELSTTAGLNVEGLGTKGCEGELTTAQRQEIQMKKAKLINMLDEVDIRYRQYHQQMQIVVASFEMAAGIGSAKSYTQLALKTISKQFRCLRDSISMQIKASSKNLGEAQKFEGSRLKLVDHQLRQQRALQQIGMMQNNSAWRPQRGLPERAVSILRAWLFENFLHPYPKDTDKHILAKQTGLTRSQVSNWFINARVRLWKPMVEEMYMEEMKNSESNTSDENTTKTRNTQENNNSRSSNKIEEILPGKSPKNPRISPINTTPMQTETKGLPGDNYLSLMAANTSHGNRFGNYAIEELGRFNGADQLGTRFHGNNVFLTLGLPPSENNKLGSRNDDSHSNIGYHDHQMVDFQNTKPFSAQLLSDFVA